MTAAVVWWGQLTSKRSVPKTGGEKVNAVDVPVNEALTGGTDERETVLSIVGRELGHGAGRATGQGESHAVARTIEERTVPGEDASIFHRIRLVCDDGRLIRVQETVKEDAATGEMRILAHEAVMGNRILVKLRDGAERQLLDAWNERHGATVERTLPRRQVYVVVFQYAELDTVPDAVRDYSTAPFIEYAEMDPIVYADATTPDDELYFQLWAMPKIDAPQAWDISTGSGRTVVGIIDTGIDLDHPDLVANLWRNPGEIDGNGLDDDGNGYVDDIHGWDFYNVDKNPDDDNFHGTHVAGTVAAVGHNVEGVAGVNWNGRVMALKFLNSSGSGSTLDAVLALEYALDLLERGIPVRLTNNSWGGGSYNQTLAETIEACSEAGMLFVAAAGNWGQNNDINNFYPANYGAANIIAVANTTSNDALASDSNYGGLTVDLAAPGTSIKSTWPGGGYSSLSGTSMAAPHVSGAAALLWDIKPLASWEEIRGLLLDGVDVQAALSGKVATDGRLNVNTAVRALTLDIEHLPLPNTSNTVSGYIVDASFMPALVLDTNSLYIAWWSDSQPLDKVAMRHVTNSWYRGVIPAHPINSTVSYYVRGRTREGVETRHPAGAPEMVHTFDVANPAWLTVTGFPGQVSDVMPSYGRHAYVAGDTVFATADWAAVPVGGQRHVLTGWAGNGSVPGAGGTNVVSFIISTNSTLTWLWGTQYELAQTGSVAGSFTTSTWWWGGATAETVTAGDELTVDGTNYRFTAWFVDGLRQPGPVSRAVNPVAGLEMHAQRNAEAFYLPELTDGDNDGMQDWWELFYTGSTSLLADGDADGDGYTNQEEFADRTDPTAASSVPEVPVIVHAPLADPQPVPAPWTVCARVTDNHEVRDVVLYWRRLPATWQQTPMHPSDTGFLYTAEIPAPGTNWNSFSYYVLAEDVAGNWNMAGLYSFDVAYPSVSFSAESLEHVLVQPGQVVTQRVSLSNSGSGPLDWRVIEVWVDDVEDGTNGWTIAGTGAKNWHIDGARSTTPVHAWHLGSGPDGTYSSSFAGSLTSPPVHLNTGKHARLTFSHWIDSELDTWTPSDGIATQAWDGGIVELSTNGVDYVQITPEGGYPYTINWWEDPQLPDFTPCYAGTGGWESAVFDITPWQGHDVFFRFRFASDGNTEFEGWYIDDIAIEDDSGAVIEWLDGSPGHGSVGPLSVDTMGLGYAGVIITGDRRARIRFMFNDPVNPSIEMPVSMFVRSPPVLTFLSAAQTSTNGEGLVTLANHVSDVDGDVCALELTVSTNSGQSWSSAWLDAVDAAWGTPTISNGLIPQVSGIQTAQGSAAWTNLVEVRWATTNGTSPVGLCTNAIVAGRLWDGTFWSSPATSQTFMVDNEPPVGPTWLAVTNHVVSVWSGDPTLGAVWNVVEDHSMPVICEVRATAIGLSDLTVSETTAETRASLFLPLDHSNWWISVDARDPYGNRSGGVLQGPFLIDTQPPSAVEAHVWIEKSSAGDYVVATNLLAAWSGFTDLGAGITGYYAALTNGSGSMQGAWFVSTNGVLYGATPNTTNSLFVWAQDALGHIGQAAAASVLVLEAGGDPDGDGHSSGDEDVAGTDATDKGSVLALRSIDSASITNGREFVVSWYGVSGRVYSVFWQNGLTNGPASWSATACTNMAGSGAMMVYTDRVDGVEHRFYRVNVRREP